MIKMAVEFIYNLEPSVFGLPPAALEQLGIVVTFADATQGETYEADFKALSEVSTNDRFACKNQIQS